MLCRLFYFIYSGSYVVINDALAILVFIYTVCASEFDPGTSTVSTETQILQGLVVTLTSRSGRDSAGSVTTGEERDRVDIVILF